MPRSRRLRGYHRPTDHVDTTQTTHISLCSGYGGIDLGLRRVIPNLRTVAYAEIEAFACELLLARMESGSLDAAPIWSNLKSFPWSAFSGRVDILSGGYPCQPFSTAGKRLGAEDERHLWPFIANGIRILRPRMCFFENVEGHITLGLSTVISDLEELDFKVSWGIFSAQECIDANGRTAPHQRKRVFIMANNTSQTRGRLRFGAQPKITEFGFDGKTSWPSRPGEPQHGWEPPRVVADTELHGCHHANAGLNADGVKGALGQVNEHWQAVGNGQLWPSRPGEPQHVWEPPRVVANTGCDAGERRGSVGEVRAGDAGAKSKGQGSSCTGTDEAWERTQSKPLCSGAESAVGDTAGAGWFASNRDDESMAGSEREEKGREPESRHASQASDCASQRKAESEVGRDFARRLHGVDISELSGLSHSELAEIYEWMVKCDNRTDELRLLGNGVVPATAARAFAVLMNELTSEQVTKQPC